VGLGDRDRLGLRHEVEIPGLHFKLRLGLSTLAATSAAEDKPRTERHAGIGSAGGIMGNVDIYSEIFWIHELFMCRETLC
jgi:hypothetical protein